MLLQTRVIDRETGSTTPGMELQACAVGDLDCTAPWGTGYTDPMGWVSLQVSLQPAASTAAYLRLTLAPSTPSSSVRLYSYFGYPFTQPRFVPYRCDVNFDALGFQTPAENQMALISLAAQFDAGIPDPNRGTVVVIVDDCMHQRAPGVAVTLSTADSQTHTTNTMLSRTAAITGGDGQLIFFGVPAGPVAGYSPPHRRSESPRASSAPRCERQPIFLSPAFSCRQRPLNSATRSWSSGTRTMRTWRGAPCAEGGTRNRSNR